MNTSFSHLEWRQLKIGWSCIKKSIGGLFFLFRQKFASAERGGGAKYRTIINLT